MADGCGEQTFSYVEKPMGSTYVTLGKDADGAWSDDHARVVGFWMRDSILELWLRLLVLQLPDPDPDDVLQSKAIQELTEAWLLASRGHFNGCVPHRLEQFARSTIQSEAVKEAIRSLQAALADAPTMLAHETLNLLGFSYRFTHDLETWCFRDVAEAWLDLFAGRVKALARETHFMPGSTPKR